jgi:hypothetical protein
MTASGWQVQEWAPAVQLDAFLTAVARGGDEPVIPSGCRSHRDRHAERPGAQQAGSTNTRSSVRPIAVDGPVLTVEAGAIVASLILGADASQLTGA